jgi:NADH-quinone oxidoreductase subunit G
MADAKQINLMIEGRQATVPEGTSILEAAKTVGVLIPHYCYHPSLSIPALCRMCLVDVEKAPKLSPACQTTVAEGAVVHVHSEKARDARKGVLEMLLINHPLDCPICDQSGECELQDYTYMEGRADSRYREPKRFNPVEDFGGDVLYVPNRCILCTRCVRYMEEVTQDPVLNVSERGDRAYIGRFEERGLTHAWAGNVVDLCPVGALLSKDFLNKARAWEVDRSASICPGCTQGCNTMIETRDNVVVRLKPRPNAEVNEFFMCDYGRLNYRWLNRRDRLESPLVRTGHAAPTVEWDVALDAAAALLRGKRAFVLASPGLSNEALFLLSRIAGRSGGAGAFRVERGPEAPLPGVDDLALRAERAPNVRGAEALGFSKTDTPLAGLRDGDVLVIADHELIATDLDAVKRASAVILLSTAMPEGLTDVDVVLPVCNMAEEEGTFTNLRGHVQRFLQAKAAPGDARPSWYVLVDVLTALGDSVSAVIPGQVFASLAQANAEFAGLSYESLGLRGRALPTLASAGAAR